MLNDQETWFQFLTGTGDFSILQSIQTGPGATQAPADHSATSMVTAKMCGTIPLFTVCLYDKYIYSIYYDSDGVSSSISDMDHYVSI
jgi:hypothetical protein